MWAFFLSLTLAAFQANALLRFPCAQLTVVRSDPLVQPGVVSGHLHQIVGGSSFDFSMPLNQTDLQSSSCSSCSVKENKSNYWTPTLYFQSPVNGTYKRIRQKPGPLTGSPNAGMVVYYIQVGTVRGFPKGFRMLSGDPMLRSYDSSIADSRSITFRCLAADDSTAVGSDTNGMPTQNCPGGVRSQINFPTCWNGKDLDSANHKSHVAYANGASFGNFGTGCPSTHPVQLPLLFLETYWDTTPYANEWRNGKSPFVWSMGDPTGYGYHADYMMGWPEATLDQAMKQCTDQGGQVSSCSVISTRSEQDMNDCAIPNRIDEDLDGWITTLPGCNPVQAGPGRATMSSGCGAPTTFQASSTVSFLRSDIQGWTPVGCASENSGETLLNGARTTITSMTVGKCLNYCNQQGFSFAGLKNKNQCTCGKTLNTSKVSSNYACNLACDGDLNEYCGAANRVAVYSGNGPVEIPTQTQIQPTQTQAQPSSSPAAPSSYVAKWGQCGGKNWTGGTVCEPGTTCKYSNDWYVRHTCSRNRADRSVIGTLSACRPLVGGVLRSLDICQVIISHRVITNRSFRLNQPIASVRIALRAVVRSSTSPDGVHLYYSGWFE
ncbi:hypothetical protein FRC16_003098 [Serendipita sp. 398]|nr:hypothetical protein FRC16_003098 [Serendipita sp. 398]